VTGKFQNKLVLFGAGKIGRSFIGQLFSRGGYEVVFIDIYKPVIDELNLRHNYNVVIKGNVESVINIQNVRGVFAGDVVKVTEEIASARIIAVSVGLNGLKSTIQLIAKGLIKRFENTEASPLDIIIAENLRNAAEFMSLQLQEHLPEGYPLEERVGLIETSIGKMVPIMLKNDMEADVLQVFAESYNTLILDKLAFKNPIPLIEGLAPKKNMKAWVDRKLFIHNLGHATSAYLGFLAHPSCNYLYEVLSDYQLKEKVRNTMIQAANILLMKYPDEFTVESLTGHIDDLLNRFQNKALGDTLFRVGCDLQRKLGAEDRIAGAIHLAREFKLPYNLILASLVCGCHFRATGEAGNILPSDLEFRAIYAKGIKAVLISICGFDEIIDSDVIVEAINLDNLLKA
jgi:mannitol-1-phosphate 5-dehydrogenase